MIDYIKTTGMVRSGNRYVINLLANNDLSAELALDKFGRAHHVPEYHDGVLYIIIFRELKSWLMSMYGHMTQFSSNPSEFIQYCHSSFITNSKSSVDEQERFNGIFDYRNTFLKRYLDFFNTHPNTVIIDLDSLTNNHLILKEILEEFNITVKGKFNDYLYHSDDKEQQKRRTDYEYNFSITDLEFINFLKNKELEERIETLTYDIHK